MADSLTYTTGARPPRDLLVRMLHISYYDWQPGDAGRPTLAEFERDEPAVPRWTADFGRPGDTAVLASARGAPVGLAWCRLLRADDSGYSYVADDIPCLAIAVVGAMRGRGVGGRMLDLLTARLEQEGVPALTLAVEVDNPARHLYPRHGFVPEAEIGGYVRMRRRLNAPARAV